jgi:hypothetical protein
MSAMDYADLKALAEKLRRPVGTLYALAAGNDPFFIGPARTAAAEWFALQWHRLNIPTGWHYRRIHYVFVSQDGKTAIVRLDGNHYENTLACWSDLCAAARDAIALELVPQDAFTDHRNGAPIIHLIRPEDGEVVVSNVAAPDLVQRMPALPALVFSPPTAPQLYHLEIWVEKTTVNDVLLPLAQQYHFNLITGIGELSATHCRHFVDRAVQSKRPVRVLYISDFDPGGLSMPVAVARKIEFEISKRGLDLDVQLRPIVLTHEQCIKNSLPRTPIKETERRATRFEERFGEGATELDALEALRPGLLRQIVLDEVLRYWNPRHDDEVSETCDDIDNRCAVITRNAHDQHRSEIDALREDWQRIAAELRAWSGRAKPVWQGSRNCSRKTRPMSATSIGCRNSTPAKILTRCSIAAVVTWSRSIDTSATRASLSRGRPANRTVARREREVRSGRRAPPGRHRPRRHR